MCGVVSVVSMVDWPAFKLTLSLLCHSYLTRSVMNYWHVQVKKGAIAISLTKGMRVTTNGPQLVSQMITK